MRILKGKRQLRGDAIILIVSIELNWQIVEESVSPEQPAQLPAPRPHRHLPRKWLIASAVMLALVIVTVV